MARGDSYQLQGQQGGVYLSGSQIATGNFRNIVALTTTTITTMTSNFVSDINAPITALVIPAGTSVGGQFKNVTISSGTAIFYYA
jgi:hypothetical protein